jgi:hypothetical protein
MVIFGQPIDVAADQASDGTTNWMSIPRNSAVKEPEITSLTDSLATSIYEFASQSPDNRTDTLGSSRVSHIGIEHDEPANIIDRIYTGTPIFSNSNPGSVRSFSVARADRNATPTTSGRYPETESCTPEYNDKELKWNHRPKYSGKK